jgi:hypothetical protein
VPAEAGIEEVTDRLVGDAGVAREDLEERVEPLARGMRRVEENLSLAADGARAARQVTERFFADAKAEIPGQLHRLLEEAECVRHRSATPTAGATPTAVPEAELLPALIHGVAKLGPLGPLRGVRTIKHPFPPGFRIAAATGAAAPASSPPQQG